MFVSVCGFVCVLAVLVEDGDAYQIPWICSYGCDPPSMGAGMQTQVFVREVRPLNWQASALALYPLF